MPDRLRETFRFLLLTSWHIEEKNNKFLDINKLTLNLKKGQARQANINKYFLKALKKIYPTFLL